MSNPEFIIGIDLGTTNSIVANTKAEISGEQKPEINQPKKVEADKYFRETTGKFTPSIPATGTRQPVRRAVDRDN